MNLAGVGSKSVSIKRIRNSKMKRIWTDPDPKHWKKTLTENSYSVICGVIFTEGVYAFLPSGCVYITLRAPTNT